MIRAKMKVRAATPADIPAMMALAQDPAAATAAHWAGREYFKIFKPDAMVQRHGLVVEAESKVVAFAIARELHTTAAPEWELENLAVALPARRRGIATRLLKELLRLALDRGATDILLEARESNHAARALYRKWGGVESGRRPGYYQNPEEPAILYRMSIPPQAKKSSKKIEAE
jgi:ribosomal-protein-alanine N-acetyltransferase